MNNQNPMIENQIINPNNMTEEYYQTQEEENIPEPPKEPGINRMFRVYFSCNVCSNFWFSDGENVDDIIDETLEEGHCPNLNCYSEPEDIEPVEFEEIIEDLSTEYALEFGLGCSCKYDKRSEIKYARIYKSI